MATPLVAKQANVRVNGAVLIAQEWVMDPTTDVLDASNFEQPSNTKVYAIGLRGVQVNVSGWMDKDVNIHDAPLSLQDGNFAIPLRLYENTVAGPFHSYPTALISRVGRTSRVNQLAMYNVQMMNFGTWDYSTGVIP